MKPILATGRAASISLLPTKQIIAKREEVTKVDNLSNCNNAIYNPKTKAFRILLVEDNLGDARLVREMLAEAGVNKFNLKHVERLGEALQHLNEDNLDVVLLDLSLPDAHGLNTVTRMHTVAPNVPIVVFTGSDDEALAVQAVREGAQDYLVKGQMDGNLLLRAMRHAIERHQLLADLEQRTKQLQVREANFRNVIATNVDGMLIVDRNGVVRFINPAAEALFDCKAEEFLGELLGCSVVADQAREFCIIRKGRETAVVEMRVVETNWEGESVYLASIRDITERKRAEEQLLYNAFYDRLTGLPNRALYMDRLRQSIERAKRHDDYLFAVLFLDFDRFKLVNDSLGHVIGDQLLIAIAARLEACLRPGDTVARLGGDEFTILLEDINDVSDVTNIADHIHKILSLPFNLSGHEVFTTASIGITLSTTGCDRPEELLRDADTAMYRAKALGKARYELFHTTMHDRAVSLLQLETGLRRAIENQEFKLHYQPIVSLETGRITGFEALVRWQHPDLGLVSPAEFIPVAEETGLIVPIGSWVMREACRQMRVWQAHFTASLPLTISVNLSLKQFTQPDLVAKIEQILYESSLDAHRLKLEITESLLLENAESATAMLLQLRALGVQLSIDDFGTGYSSLSHLHRLPFNTLKIDRSFVSNMDVGSKNAEIVRAIATLAHNLGMDVTAEGVETADQLAQLRALQCKHGQGYFFSKPVDGKAAGALIAQNLQW